MAHASGELRGLATEQLRSDRKRLALLHRARVGRVGESDVPKMEDARHYSEDLVLLVVAEGQAHKRFAQHAEVFPVAHPLDLRLVSLKVLEAFAARREFQLIEVAALVLHQLIEDMEVPLVRALAAHAGHLQQVVDHHGILAPLGDRVNEHLDPLAEAARVAVAYRLGVPESLEYGIELKHPVLQPSSRAVPGAERLGDVEQHELRALRLPRSRLTGDEHGLTTAFTGEVGEEIGANTKDVRCQATGVLRG
mmetsp:Transcript_49070/g.137395  ORF Transcript_49070/g.137395 Transcript_49070/m.137395 type:complete len:251 (+) Transcript_49070:1027-1779(+)